MATETQPQAKLEQCWRCKRTSAAGNMFPGPICESCSDACWDEEPEVEYEDHGRD